MRVTAYVIHTRPFQESKVMLDLFSLELGLLRGVYRLPKKGTRVIPSPFVRYDIELKGRTDLKTIALIEPLHKPVRIEGIHLYASLYVHELLSRLITSSIPVADLFVLYEWLLQSIENMAPIAPLLRRFEVGLFQELGMPIDMAYTGSGEALVPTQLYRFDFKFGLRPFLGDKPKQLPVMFVEGEVAIQYMSGAWSNKDVLLMSKELHRKWLDYLLSGKKLEARRLLPNKPYRGDRLFGVPKFTINKVTV
ncbi:DNA repair protein RecO [Marinomonas algicola]|uniref:DNA repair protein RecO n=1 Tax=Marinomonas algicola TaxID=2773454 RepID=UPI00174E30B5|nr:DNA repair protein RecO [Marinomonas algicola]